MRRRLRIILPLGILFAIHGFVLCAGFFAPYDYATQDRNAPFEPPARIRFRDSRGGWRLLPFVERRDADHSVSAAPLRLFVRGSEYSIAGIPSTIHLFGVKAPGYVHLLGTDGLGRDQLSRLLYGGRLSLLTGLAGTAISLLLGITLGAVSGFFTGWIDELVMAAAEVFRALPWMYFLLGIRAILPLHLPAEAVLVLIAVISGTLGWTMPARLIRGAVLTLRERGYVTVAHGFGASSFYLIRRHILPDTAGIVLTQASLLIPKYIMVEVTLSFLGLGVSEPVPTWGNMLSSLQDLNVLVSYWWMWTPGLLLLAISLAYLVLASALLDLPRLYPSASALFARGDLPMRAGRSILDARGEPSGNIGNVP